MIIFTEETPMFKEFGDYFSTQTLPKNSFFINAYTTGKIKLMVDITGLLWKQKRIEVKMLNSQKSWWVVADGILTDELSNENLLKYKNKGYRAFKLK